MFIDRMASRDGASRLCGFCIPNKEGVWGKSKPQYHEAL